MCISPISIKNNSVYKVGFNQPTCYDVPCGHCLECRSLAMSEWQSRLSYEIKDLYDRKGVAVFLTFTYNNEHLPTIDLGDIVQPCFDRKAVLRFLNRLKVRAYRWFGKHSYKYFFTSEYGSHTKRPHYHALFFLESYVDVVQFCELCRELWTYGYMFPKYDLKRACYVDNFGKVSQVTIRSLVGGAKYVSKYITKDMSFYDLPHVARHLSCNKDCDKNFLPKHWQSNGLGYSLVRELQANSLDSVYINNALHDGLFNPLFAKKMPLPRYVLNKLMYDNVFTGRMSVDGRKMYDRQLSSFGRAYMRDKISVKLSKTTGDFYSFLSNLSEYDKLIKEFGYEKLYKLSSKYLDKVSDCKPLATYMLVWKYIPHTELVYHCNHFYGDLDFIGNFDLAASQYVIQHDTEYFRACLSEPSLCAPDLFQREPVLEVILSELDYIVCCYNSIFNRIRKEQSLHFQRLNNAVNKMRLYFNAFPNNLC